MTKNKEFKLDKISVIEAVNAYHNLSGLAKYDLEEVVKLELTQDEVIVHFKFWNVAIPVQTYYELTNRTTPKHRFKFWDNK